MNIGVDINTLLDKNYSGISNYTANLLSALSKLDTENEYKLFYNSFKKDERLNKWQEKRFQLYASSWPNKIFNYLLQKTLSWPKVDKYLGGVNVFWSPHFNFTSLSDETKKIITVHDLSFLRYPEFFAGRKNFWHKALRVKKILQRADKIIAVSENTKQDIVSLLNIKEEKVRVIYSGYESNVNVYNDEEKKVFLNKYSLQAGFFLYLGNIEPRKNLVSLISAYNLWRERNSESFRRLVLAGSRGWKNRKIYQMAKKSPFAKDIIFTGYVDNKDRALFYQTASLFIYPSFYEGFGFPPLEALSYNLPVICSNVSSLPEVVGGAAVLIDPLNIQTIIEAIEEVLRDEDLRVYLKERGREQLKKFSWEKTARAYLEEFEKLAV